MSRHPSNATLEQKRQFALMTCRFEQEFARAWTRSSPEHRHSLEIARHAFNEMLSLIENVLQFVFTERVTDLVNLIEITGLLELDAEDRLKSFKTLHEWNAFTGEELTARPRLTVDSSVYWLLCPPVGSSPVFQWCHSAESAAKWISDFYYSFVIVIDSAMDLLRSEPGRIRLKGRWEQTAEGVFPSLVILHRRYLTYRKKKISDDPGRAYVAEVLGTSTPENPSYINREQHSLESTTWHICEGWLWNDNEMVGKIAPSTAKASWEDSRREWDAAPEEVENLDAPADGNTEDGELAVEEAKYPVGLFKALTNSEMATQLDCSPEAIALRRKRTTKESTIERQSKMPPFVVRRLFVYFSKKSGDKKIRAKAADHLLRLASRSGPT